MTDHAELLETFLAQHARMRGHDVITSLATGDGRTVELTQTQLRAAVDELKQRRAERLGDTHAVAKVIAATNRHARGDSLTQLHQAIDALERRFDDRWELLEDDAALQQPARDSLCGNYSRPGLGGVLGPCTKPAGHGTEWHIDAVGASWEPEPTREAP